MRSIKICPIILLFMFFYTASGQVTVDGDHLWHKEALERVYKRLKFKKLSKMKLKQNEAEIRLWIFGEYPGFSLRGFILRKTDNQITTSFIAWNQNSVPAEDFNPYNEAEMAKLKAGKKIIKKIQLNTPKNGWEMFADYLKTNDLYFDFNLSLDTAPNLPDATEKYIIEVKNSKEYKFRGYRLHTKDADGKKIRSLCYKLSEDFSVKVFCG